MDVKMMIQSTPNPNALKFVLNVPVKTEGKVTYKTTEDCIHNPLAQKLFALENVTEVFFFDNYITITQDGNADWDTLEEQVKKAILDNIADHDPDFKTEEHQQFKPQSDDPEIAKINAILDETVRPALQMDGGDLHVLELQGNVLKITYQGACGSCPSSAMGTLKAVENLLRDQYNPELTVELA